MILWNTEERRNRVISKDGGSSGGTGIPRVLEPNKLRIQHLFFSRSCHKCSVSSNLHWMTPSSDCSMVLNTPDSGFRYIWEGGGTCNTSISSPLRFSYRHLLFHSIHTHPYSPWIHLLDGIVISHYQLEAWSLLLRRRHRRVITKYAPQTLAWRINHHWSF